MPPSSPSSWRSTCGRLRLSGILDTLEVRTQQAIAEHWSYAEFLSRLVQDEAERREHKALGLRVRRGQVIRHQDPGDLRLRLQPEHQSAAVFDLATCTFIRQKRNVLICGQTDMRSHYPSFSICVGK